MGRHVIRWTVVVVILVILASLWQALPTQMQGTTTVSGVVMRTDGKPAVGAIVRRQTATQSVQTGVDGTFTLDGLAAGQPVTVTAWLEDYYVGWKVFTPPVNDLTLTVRPYPTADNESYLWRSALDAMEDPNFRCSHCMVAFPEWNAGAHGQSARNPRFFSMYNGTDISATVETGPGYKTDFSGTAGNCATCHAPAAAARRRRAFSMDMNLIFAAAEQEGVSCDFCHHIGAVYLNPATGLPYPNAPGVLSYRLYRTYDPDVLFFGSLDDVTRRVSYLPLEKKSQFCAPCHQFSFWGTPIYQSFREWLESPYPAQGIECQTCHMPPETVPYFVYPNIPGSLARDPSTLASHLDLGVKDVEFMQKAVAMTVTAEVSGTRLMVDVAITNIFAGHHVPTDYPGRNMVLVVRATDTEGLELVQLSGPQVPDWGGQGLQPDDYAGKPGKGFAKILRDRATGEHPVVSYWKQTFIHSDNRIPAGATDTSHYEFDASPLLGSIRRAPSSGGKARATDLTAQVEATLLFRRLYIAQARQKGWNTPDIVMAHQEVLAANPD